MVYDPELFSKLLRGRPRIGPDTGFDMLTNRQGFKISATDSSAPLLKLLGWRQVALDMVNLTAPIKDRVLIFRYRGGVGDIITMEPTIRALAEIVDVDLLLPRLFHFLFHHIDHVRVENYTDWFGDLDGKNREVVTRYWDIRERYLLSIDMFCPAGYYEDTMIPEGGLRAPRIEAFAEVTGVNPSRPKVIATRRMEQDAEEISMEESDSRFGDLFAGERPIVGIQTKSENVSKDWPVAYYYQLCMDLIRHNIIPVVFHMDTPMMGVPSIVGQPLPVVAGAISHLDLMLGPDSGLLHMAAAMHIPSLWLFGPTDGPLTIKYYDEAQILTGYTMELPCKYPCYYDVGYNDYYCQNRHGDCMLNIRPNVVLHKVLEMLGAH